MAANLSRRLEELEITKDELNRLGEALKNEEFRKLLTEYAEDVNSAESIKTYQNETRQLELERGVDVKFINPEPGFVIKTSLDGKKKCFVNICQNSIIGKPSYTRCLQNGKNGLSWSIPFSQSPGQEDLDKKRNLCMVYDVVFHPDTLHLAYNNQQFKQTVVDTALNAVEDSFKVTLDKQNIIFPKMKYKGHPRACVIRTKSKQGCTMTEEEKQEFDGKFRYSHANQPEAKEPEVKTLSESTPKEYTTPSYNIKYQSDVDMQDFTFHRNAKLNCTIPKNMIIDIHLPLLRSAQEVTLDVMEKSVLLISEKPAKYKLELQLPYRVEEERGNAKFDTDTRTLTITLPVKQQKSYQELLREDSGVESDIGDRCISNDEESPVGSMEKYESTHLSREENRSGSPSDELQLDFRTKSEIDFLNPNYHFIFPSFTCNLDSNVLIFVINVKNCDPDSIVTKTINTSAVTFKFTSIGSGYFPVHYAMYIGLEDSAKIEELTVEAWDNNVIATLVLFPSTEPPTKYFTGLSEDSLTEYKLESPRIIFEELKELDEDGGRGDIGAITVITSNVEHISLEIKSDGAGDKKDELDSLDEDDDSMEEMIPQHPVKQRTMSECHELSGSVKYKGILKKRINRSLSESNAEEYAFNLSLDGMESDPCIPEEDDGKQIKKTVRFNDQIRKQTFRANSSILGQRKKNQKRNRNKKLSSLRRASESETSELDDKDDNNPVIDDEQCKRQTVIGKKRKQQRKNINFKSNLIFDLDD